MLFRNIAFQFLRVVPDYLGLDHIDHVFRYIGSVIAYALEETGYKKKLDGPWGC